MGLSKGASRVFQGPRLVCRSSYPWYLIDRVWQERLNDLYEFRFDCHTWSLTQFSDAYSPSASVNRLRSAMLFSVQVCAKHGRASQWQILAGRRGSERDEGLKERKGAHQKRFSLFFFRYLLRLHFEPVIRKGTRRCSSEAFGVCSPDSRSCIYLEV